MWPGKKTEKKTKMYKCKNILFLPLSSCNAPASQWRLLTTVLRRSAIYVLPFVMMSACAVAEKYSEEMIDFETDSAPFDDNMDDDFEGDSAWDSGVETDECPDDPDKLFPGVCGCGIPDIDTDDWDGDGVPNCIDQCPEDPDRTEYGICDCGLEEDFDNDGTLDCVDECPEDENKTEPGQCGCGMSDMDQDGDGLADCNDDCPNDPNKTDPGECGCGQEEGTCGVCANALLSTERLYVGEHICSENGEFMFGMLESGELALWSEAETLWSAGISNGYYVHMQLLGNLVVYDADTLAVWASHTSGNQGAYLTLENDSRVIIWLDDAILWEIGGNTDE